MNTLQTICLEFTAKNHFKGSFKAFKDNHIQIVKEKICSELLHKFDKFKNIELSDDKKEIYFKTLKRQTLDFLIKGM